MKLLKATLIILFIVIATTTANAEEKKPLPAPFWDKTCADKSAVMWRMVEVNNAIVAGDLGKLKVFYAVFAQHAAQKNGTSVDDELTLVKKMVDMQAKDKDFQTITKDNYKDHLKFDVIKDNELYKVETHFSNNGTTSGLSNYFGCVAGKPELLF